MTEIASLKIRVDALDAKAATDALNKMAPAAGKAEKSVKGVSSASSALNKVLGVTVGYLSARQVLQAAESWTTLNNRLRLVTDSAEGFNSAQESIFRIAQETRQGLTATAELYQRIAQNQKELGLTGKETADIVQTINQALVVSGTAGAGAQAALVQLGQAFASGTLRGEELNAVLEQAPALAQAIAAGIGVTVGQLRALGAEGVLTADAVVQALQNQAEAVEEKFASMAPTVSGALTQLDNSFIQLIGRMDESTGASANASSAISDLARVLSDPKTIAAANELSAGLATAFSGIVTGATWLVETIRWMAEETAAAMGGIGLHDVDRLEEEASRLQVLLDKVRGEGYGPGTAIFDNLLGSFDENEKRLNQAYSLLDLQTKVTGKQKEAPEVTKTVTATVVELGAATGELTEEQKAAIKTANDLDKAHKANERQILDLAEALYQASLPADELAKRQAMLSLNKYATPEQIASVQQLAGELQRVEDIQGRKETFGQDPSATIRGTVTPLSGGPFDDQFARFEAEREAEELRYQEQQTRLQEAQALDLLTRQEYYALEQQMAQENADRLAQIEQAKTSMLLSTGEQTFGSLAALAKEHAGEQSALYKTMFAASKAFSIAQSLVAIQTGIALAAANPWPANLAAMASVAAATAGIVSDIASVAAPSFEGGGFTGSGPRSGGMDGKGGFMAMVHPNETIIDHTKGQSAGGGVTVNVIESKDKAGTQEKRMDADGNESVDVFVSDIYGDGPRGKAIQRAFGLSRVGQ